MTFSRCKVPGCSQMGETEILGYYFCPAHADELDRILVKAYSDWMDWRIKECSSP